MSNKTTMNDLIMHCALAYAYHRPTTTDSREVFIYKWLGKRTKKLNKATRDVIYDILAGFGKRITIPNYFNVTKVEFMFDMYLAAVLGGPHKLPRGATRIDPVQYAQMFD